MRVLQVHNRYQVRGGEDAVVDAEAALLQDHGHTVQRLLRDNAALSASASAASRVAMAAQALWSTSARREMTQRLAAFRPDVVHVHNTWPQVSPAVLGPVRAAGVPLVATLHNVRLLCPQGMFLRDERACTDCLGRPPWPAVQHGCYRGSRAQSAVLAGSLVLHRALRSWADVDAWIVLSEASRRVFAQAGWPEDGLFVRPNFSPAVDAVPGPLQREGLLFVGRLSPEKGVDVLAEAVRRSRDRGQTWTLTVLGEGPERARLEGLPGVVCRGRATPAEVAAAMAQARALVVPSRVAEHSPRVVVEALAQGLPVVGSDLGSVPELLAASPDDASAVGGLGPSEAGWRVPPGDAEALAQALGVAHDEVHIDPTQALARQRLALAMHAARHAPAVHADALRAIYAAAARRARQRSTALASTGRSR